MKTVPEKPRARRRGIAVLGGLGCSLALLLGGALALVSSARESLPPRPSPTGADPLTLAKCSFAERSYLRAESLVREAVRLSPESREAQVLLGRVLIERGRLAEARELLSALLKRTPDDVTALSAMALALRRLGLADLALAHLQHAAKLSPNDPGVWKDLGQAQREKGDSMGALASFQKSLSLDGKQEDLMGLISELASAKQDLPGALPGTRGPLSNSNALLPKVPRPTVPDPNDQFPKPYWRSR